jgi:hypothetical protein
LLSELFSTPSAKANVIALVSQPADRSAEWGDDLEVLTTKIQNELQGQVLIDIDSEKARRFGMLTSGHIIAYGADGTLLYSGGITSSRGDRSHGPSFDALKKIVTQAERTRGELENEPVFGCELTSA